MVGAFECRRGARITTLLVRGVPRKYSAWDVVGELDAIMSREAYDFVYLPRKRNAPANMGFVFLNFVSPSAADAAIALLSGRQWTGARMLKPSVADVQGLSDNLRRFRNAMGYLQGKELAHAPLVFKNGQPVRIEVALGPRYSGDVASAAGRPVERAFDTNAFVDALLFEAPSPTSQPITSRRRICDDGIDASSSYSATHVPSSPRSSGASSPGDVHETLLDGACSVPAPSESWSAGHAAPTCFAPPPCVLPPPGLSLAQGATVQKLPQTVLPTTLRRDPEVQLLKGH